MSWEGVGAARDLGTGPAVPTAKPRALTPCSPVSSARLSGAFKQDGEEEPCWLRTWRRVAISRVWSVCWNFPNTCASSPKREGLLINHSAGPHKHPARRRLLPSPDPCTGTLGMELACLGWSWHADLSSVFFVSLGISEKQCIF